jgi:hypothetical protein
MIRATGSRRFPVALCSQQLPGSLPMKASRHGKPAGPLRVAKRPPAAGPWLTAAMAGILTLSAGSIHAEPSQRQADVALVKSLLRENLPQRSFDFAIIAEACSGKRVLPLDDSPAHRRALAAIETALSGTIRELNTADSPVRKLRRINEASRFFEDGLRARLSAMHGFSCDSAPTRAGDRQRSGYPDLRLVDKITGTVFYLDPKLVEQGSINSTLRSFYFEPKSETLKITDDAVHLLIGIEHDGKTGEWNFGRWRLVDLSRLKVRLKAEFQASNADLYEKSVLPLPAHPP